jgi:hypothetical protein
MKMLEEGVVVEDSNKLEVMLSMSITSINWIRKSIKWLLKEMILKITGQRVQHQDKVEGKEWGQILRAISKISIGNSSKISKIITDSQLPTFHQQLQLLAEIYGTRVTLENDMLMLKFVKVVMEMN